MILAATNPETSGFGWSYAIGAIEVAAVLIALGFLACLIDRVVTRRRDEHVSRALDKPARPNVPCQPQPRETSRP